LLASVAAGTSRLRGLSDCEDTAHLMACMRALGASCQADGAGAWRIQGIAGPPQGEVELDVGEAGSSLRFLLALCAAGDGVFTLRGTPRLMSRPHRPLLECLEQLGARFERVDDQTKPAIRVHACGLQPGKWPVPNELSSQFVSGMAMAAASGPGAELQIPVKLPSRGYFDLTLEAIRAFGSESSAHLTASDASGMQGLSIAAGGVQAQSMQVPGDPSAATFLLTAIALLQRAAQLEPRWSEVHPEAQLLNSLRDAGLFSEQSGIWAAKALPTKAAVEVQLDPAPDAGPGLAVFGCMLPHGMILHGVERLRAKESDRVDGIRRLLRLVGQEIELERDSLRIPGGGVLPAADCETAFDPDQDHRLAMAAGLLQLVQPKIRVSHPECVAKSFPNFWELLAEFSA